MSHTGFHTFQPIKQLLAMGDNKLKSICQHEAGTATAIREELQAMQQRGLEHLVIGNCMHKQPNGQCAGHILPTGVTRTDDGYYCHPGVPDFGDDGEAMANWIYEQQLATAVSFLFDEPAESEPFHSYFNKDSSDISAWQPPSPPGEGWFILCIVETDDGPACWWVKHKTDLSVCTIPLKGLVPAADAKQCA